MKKEDTCEEMSNLLIKSIDPLEHMDYETNREYVDRVRDAMGLPRFTDEQLKYFFPEMIPEAIYPKFQFKKEYWNQ